MAIIIFWRDAKKDSDFAKAYAKAYVKVLPYWPYVVQFWAGSSKTDATSVT